MSGHVYFYDYTTCTKPGQWAVICIVAITIPVQSQDCYHYTTCTKPGKWAVMCIVTITLTVQSQDNERSYVLLPSFHMLRLNCKLTVARGVTFQAYRMSCAFYYGYAVVLCVLRSDTFQAYHAHRTICYRHKNVASPTSHNLLIFYQFPWMNSGFRSTSSYRIRFNTNDNFCLYLHDWRYSIWSSNGYF